jgi:anti-sigma factor RsiW
MTLTHDCGNNEALVAYIYDECSPSEREAIATHVSICARCAAEVASLQATRTELVAWTPPETELGFRLPVDPPTSNVIRPAGWWRQPLPAWAQAAAAALIFTTGAGLGALRGTTREPVGANRPPTAASQPGAAAAPVSPQDLAALEQRLRGEMQQLRPAAAATVRAAESGASGLTLQQVRALIAESEQRQQRELTLRTAEVIRDFDTQRRGDLARIQQTMGRLEGTTTAEVEQQRQTLNYLLRVSQRQP